MKTATLFTIFAIMSFSATGQTAVASGSSGAVTLAHNRPRVIDAVPGPTLGRPDKPGEIGRLAFGRVTVASIVSTNEALVYYQWPGESYVHREQVLIRGLPTEGMIAGPRAMTNLFTVAGTYTFTTVLGSSKTVAVLTPSEPAAVQK